MGKQMANDDQIVADSEAEDTASVQQYVSFLVDGELFGLEINKVQEIIRIPDLARVPMTPRTMLGLANLRGEILPVFDLRMMLDVVSPETSDASRVIVVEDQFKVGLVVDRVAQVLNVPEDRIEDAEAIEKTIASNLLTGVVKNFGNYDLVQLFDPARLPEFTSFEISDQAAGTTASNGLLAQRLALPADAQNSDENDDVQIVSLSIGQEEYAFDLAEVDEIVRVPETVSEVPNAPHSVVGLTSLRDRVLPLISLRACLGVPQEAANDSNRVVVLQIADDSGVVRRFGVIVDRAREVLRIPDTQVEQVPNGVKRQGSGDVRCICKLDSGKRLISVLSAREIFAGLAAGGAEEVLVQANKATQDNGRAENEGEQDMEDERYTDDEQLVVFNLAEESFGISIHAVQEIIRLPEKFVAVPKSGFEIEGLVNLRGLVMPVIDMRRHFHLDPCERSERQRIVVLSIKGSLTGYIVDSVVEVMTITAGALKSPPTLNTEAARYVRKVAMTRDGAQMVLVLDGAAFEPIDLEEIGMDAAA
jgi:purine-binding chemotaxis protein CheW